MQSRVCSACSRRIEWDLACVSREGGWRCRWREGWRERERGGRLHVQKRVLAHLAYCHLGLARKRGGSNNPLAFYSRALTNGCGKDGGFLSLRLVLSVNTLKESHPIPPPLKSIFSKLVETFVNLSIILFQLDKQFRIYTYNSRCNCKRSKWRISETSRRFLVLIKKRNGENVSLE